MPDVSAVLFDYGLTLVTFEYPKAQLAEVVERYRPAIAAAAGFAAPSVEEIISDVLLPLEAVVDNPGEDEVPYLEVFADAWRKAGLELPPDLLFEILDAEQRVWDRAARVDGNALDVLAWLREQGLRTGVCSNAPFPAAMMRRQVEAKGIGPLVDAVVFSSEVGRRKPAPEMYRAALDAVGADAAATLFVGDRVREDYEGPRALGMRAVICTAHAVRRPGPEVPTIESLKELPEIL